MKAKLNEDIYRKQILTLCFYLPFLICSQIENVAIPVLQYRAC